MTRDFQQSRCLLQKFEFKELFIYQFRWEKNEINPAVLGDIFEMKPIAPNRAPH